MKKIKTFFEWVVFSSKDPEKISLTLKGILGAGVTAATIGMNLAGVGGASELGQVVDALISAVQSFAVLVTSIMTVYGLVRKLYSTVKGENQVLNG